ncbi:polyphosphate kinase 1 [Arcticibacter tournemirensis]
MGKINQDTMTNSFFNRDISWLSFNERVLEEAARENIPLLERIKFLSIYSSNLDEFFRVRMPVIKALGKIEKKQKDNNIIAENASAIINIQQARFGNILTQSILPRLEDHKVHLIYNEPLPKIIQDDIREYFLNEVLAFLQLVNLSDETIGFFPENNKLYFLLNVVKDGEEHTIIVNIPSDQLPRFYSKRAEDGILYIVFLDDIVRYNTDLLFKGSVVNECFSFKVTRDAEIDLADEYSGDLLDQISRVILKREQGLATRFLHQPGIPGTMFKIINNKLNLKHAQFMEGGVYHNLKDLMNFPYFNRDLSYKKWEPVRVSSIKAALPMCQQIAHKDLIFHTPYHSYNPVLRFFNEAATNADVEEIYVTLYRVASNSRIVNALITAAKNGKKVTVLVELKARFDEANNVKWARKMKEAGVRLIYSISSLKVHAKIALVKKRDGTRLKYTGLLATGNFNEKTASLYTDHILMTSHKGILREIELLFIFLARKERPKSPELIPFKYLLVSQFNLLSRFLELLDREISFANQGKEAAVTIKLNNLEEQVLISKLYEASAAGVKISLIVRGICCLIPGVEGMSENIKVRRIVDRYLEHGRIFLFNNGGEQQLFLGSADWMNRNIYRRIEVCFPILDGDVKKEIISILNLQLMDNIQAVNITSSDMNAPLSTGNRAVQSQKAIYDLIYSKNDQITTEHD